VAIVELVSLVAEFGCRLDGESLVVALDGIRGGIVVGTKVELVEDTDVVRAGEVSNSDDDCEEVVIN
jgi:hypothetical protein